MTITIENALHQTLLPVPVPPQHRSGPQVLASNRGSISTAMTSPERFAAIDPSSPRSKTLLVHTRYSDNLTATDMWLWELCLTVARAGGLRPDEPYAITSDQVKAVLGWNANPKYLRAAFERLRQGTLEVMISRPYWREKGVHPMLHPNSQVVRFPDGAERFMFMLSDAARRLMLIKERYEHVELQAMARFKSKWSFALYKWLLVRAWNPRLDTRPGTRGAIEGIDVQVEPKALAKQIGWVKKGEKFNFGAFKREVLDPALADLKHVKRYGVVYTTKHGTGRGKPVAAINFNLLPSVPDWRILQTPRKKAWTEGTREEVEALEPDHTRVQAALFYRAAGHSGYAPVALYRAWQIALAEAMSGELIDGHEERQWRGAALLEALKRQGPDDACWAVLVEEMQSPSLLRIANDLELLMKARHAQVTRVAASSLSGLATEKAGQTLQWLHSDDRTLTDLARNAVPAKLKPRSLLIPLSTPMTERGRALGAWLDEHIDELIPPFEAIIPNESVDPFGAFIARL